MKSRSLFLLILLIASCRSGDSTPTVGLCGLLLTPDEFDGRRVRIHAVYRYGFEWSEFYCLRCDGPEHIWVAFSPRHRTCTKRLAQQALGGDSLTGRTVEVTVTGTFHSSGGRYGHMNAFDYLFVVDCVEEARTLLNSSPVPSALPQDKLDRFRVCRAGSLDLRSSQVFLRESKG